MRIFEQSQRRAGREPEGWAVGGGKWGGQGRREREGGREERAGEAERTRERDEIIKLKGGRRSWRACRTRMSTGLSLPLLQAGRAEERFVCGKGFRGTMDASSQAIP